VQVGWRDTVAGGDVAVGRRKGVGEEELLCVRNKVYSSAIYCMQCIASLLPLPSFLPPSSLYLPQQAAITHIVTTAGPRHENGGEEVKTDGAHVGASACFDAAVPRGEG